MPERTMSIHNNWTGERHIFPTQPNIIVAEIEIEGVGVKSVQLINLNVLPDNIQLQVLEHLNKMKPDAANPDSYYNGMVGKETQHSTLESFISALADAHDSQSEVVENNTYERKFGFTVNGEWSHLIHVWNVGTYLSPRTALRVGHTVDVIKHMIQHDTTRTELLEREPHNGNTIHADDRALHEAMMAAPVRMEQREDGEWESIDVELPGWVAGTDQDEGLMVVNDELWNKHMPIVEDPELIESIEMREIINEFNDAIESTRLIDEKLSEDTPREKPFGARTSLS